MLQKNWHDHDHASDHVRGRGCAHDFLRGRHIFYHRECEREKKQQRRLGWLKDRPLIPLEDDRVGCQQGWLSDVELRRRCWYQSKNVF